MREEQLAKLLYTQERKASERLRNIPEATAIKW